MDNVSLRNMYEKLEFTSTIPIWCKIFNLLGVLTFKGNLQAYKIEITKKQVKWEFKFNTNTYYR